MRLIKAHPVKKRGRIFWRVRTPPIPDDPRFIDKWFLTQEAADQEAKTVNQERLARCNFHRLDISEKTLLMLAYDRGGGARAVYDTVSKNAEPAATCTVANAVAALIADRTDANKSPVYVSHLRWTLEHFARNKGHREIGSITVQDVREWLQEIGGTPDMKRAYLNRVRMLFTFAAHSSRRWCKDNPAKGITMPARRDADIEIYTPDEASAIMQAAKEDKNMVAYFALCMFAGLRPSEARRMQPENIKADFIHVSAKVARKKKEARNIEMNDALRAWLAIADPLPVPKNWRKRFRGIVKASGVKWKQDGMRHSFVTYFNLLNNWDETSRQAGHSIRIMLEHYRGLNATKADAEKFFGMRP